MKFVLSVENWGPDTAGVRVSVEQRGPGMYATSYIGTLKLRKEHWKIFRRIFEDREFLDSIDGSVVEIRDGDAPSGRA